MTAEEIQSARVCAALVTAHRAVDELVAEADKSEGTAELLLAGPALLVSFLEDDLQDALYRSEKLDRSHAADDPAGARAIATAA